MVKRGFSLAEALIVMTILSVFFAFAARTVSTKQNMRRQNVAHGYYECCYVDGNLVERYVIGGVEEATTDAVGGVCNFRLRPGIAMFWIQANVDDMFYYSLTEPNVNRNLAIRFFDRLMQIRDGNGAWQDVPPTDGVDGEHFENYLKATYENSLICNLGGDGDCNPRSGVIISW